MTSSHSASPPQRRIVTPAWTKNAGTPALAEAPEPRPRKAQRRAKSEAATRAELPPLPGGDGFFITRPDVLLAFLGETVAFELPSPADLPTPDEDEPELDEPDAREATALPLRSPEEVTALCHQHLGFADGLALEVHARMGERATADLVVSAARLGLWHAAQRFDPSRRVSFEVFAKRRITGAILDELRAERLVPPRRGSRSPGLVAMLAGCSYESKPEELYGADDIAWLSSWGAESGVRAIAVAGAVSLSGAINGDQERADEALERAELLHALSAAVAELEAREQVLVDGVYFRGLTLERAIDVTRAHGSRVLSEALVRLKRAMLRAGYRERFAKDALPPLVSSR